jgi:hypothetical protein
MRYLVIAISSVVLFFPAFWLFASVVGPDWGAGIAAVAMYIALPLVALKIWPATKPPAYESMEAALAEGTLRSADYEVEEAVEFGQMEDEGRHYLLGLADRRVLFLSGQYLDQPVTARIFPSTRIRVFWHGGQGHTFGVEGLGGVLTVSRKLPPISGKVLESDVLPADRDVLSESLETLVKRFVDDT